MSSPIPRRLLPHTVTVERYISTAKSGPVYRDSIEFQNVRVEPVKQNALSSLGDAKADRFLLFIDCKNSLAIPHYPTGDSLPTDSELPVDGLGFIPSIKDRVTFQGQAMVVRTITPFYGSGQAVHHYEARLA